jgi:hypothetical protein
VRLCACAVSAVCDLKNPRGRKCDGSMCAGDDVLQGKYFSTTADKIEIRPNMHG